MKEEGSGTRSRFAPKKLNKGSLNMIDTSFKQNRNCEIRQEELCKKLLKLWVHISKKDDHQKPLWFLYGLEKPTSFSSSSCLVLLYDDDAVLPRFPRSVRENCSLSRDSSRRMYTTANSWASFDLSGATLWFLNNYLGTNSSSKRRSRIIVNPKIMLTFAVQLLVKLSFQKFLVLGDKCFQARDWL